MTKTALFIHLGGYYCLYFKIDETPDEIADDLLAAKPANFGLQPHPCAPPGSQPPSPGEKTKVPQPSN